MHPVLLQIGSFNLPTYGVLLAIGLLVAIYMALRMGRREGLDANRLLDFSTWLIIVGLIGAKVLMIVTEWGEYKNNPRDIFSLTTIQAGGVFYGGLIAATLFALGYVRRYHLPLLKVFDAYAPAIAIGHAIGRLGCFAAGDDYGKPTHFFLGVVFTNKYTRELSGTPLGVRLHPVQLYESAALLAIFGILMWRYPRKKRDGEIFLAYVGLYAVARFFLEFFRGDPDRGFVFNGLLSTSQFIAVLALITAGFCAYRLYRRPPMTISNQEAREAPAAAGGRRAAADARRAAVAAGRVKPVRGR